MRECAAQLKHAGQWRADKDQRLTRGTAEHWPEGEPSARADLGAIVQDAEEASESLERGGRGRGDDGVRSSALGGRDERAAAMGEKRQKRAHRTGRSIRREQEAAPTKPVRTSQCQLLEDAA